MKKSSWKKYGYYFLFSIGLMIVVFYFYQFDDVGDKQSFLDENSGTGSYADSLAHLSIEKDKAKTNLKNKDLEYQQGLTDYDQKADQILSRQSGHETVLSFVDKLQKYYSQDGTFLINRSDIDKELTDAETELTLGVKLNLKCSYKNWQRFLNLIDVSGKDNFSINDWRVPLVTMESANWREKEDELLKLEPDENRMINADLSLKIHFAKFGSFDSSVKIQLAEYLVKRLAQMKLPKDDTLYQEAINLLEKARNRQLINDYPEAYNLASQSANKLQLLEINLHSLATPNGK
jgi:hypothetical protein